MGRTPCDLTREIVLAESGPSPVTAEMAPFDGASTFYLWGCVFANGRRKSRVEIAQTIAHETGHLLLFGLMAGRPLAENDYTKRYSSPLREDPRPIEGLVHAAYVLARMHYCLATLVSAGVLTAEEREKAVFLAIRVGRRMAEDLFRAEGHLNGGCRRAFQLLAR